MPGMNLYLLAPEVDGGRFKAKVYLRYRPDDANPGTEMDLGVAPEEIDVPATNLGPNNTALQMAVAAAITNAHGALDVAPVDLSIGLMRFFAGKEWKGVRP